MEQISKSFTASALGRLAVFAIAVLTPFADGSRAADVSRAFLESLRQHNYFDVAIDHLERMRGAREVSDATKKIIDYELGVTLLASAKANSDLESRDKLLVRAYAALARFLEDSPQHSLAAAAKGQLGGVLVERGRTSLDRAAVRGTDADKRQQAAEQARVYYREAEGLFAALEAASAAEARKLPKVIAQTNSSLRQAQETALRKLLESRMAAATLPYEIARTYAPGSDENRANLEVSAQKFHACYERHNPLLGGLYARMWEGRCLRDLQQFDEAMRIFAEIAGQPDEPAAIRELKNKAVVLSLETALMPQVKRCREATAMFRAWQTTAKPAEARTNDALAIRYLGGKAALESARTMQGDDEGRRADIAMAADALRFVSQLPGEFQTRAGEELQSRDFAAELHPQDETLTFAAAKDRAAAAFDRMQEIEARRKLESSEKLDREYVQARDESLHFFRDALELAPADATTDELNAIRYYLCYLCWASDQFEESAAMGEMLVQRYPSSAGAKPAAKIAMAAYAKLAAGKTAEEAAIAMGKMTALVELAARQWAGEPEADQAWAMLAAAAIRSHDIDKALEHIAKIPETSPTRNEAEWMAGQTLWNDYLSAMRTQGPQRSKQAELDRFLLEAEKLLTQGVGRSNAAEKDAPSAALSAAILSLAQISLETGQGDKAVGHLEEPLCGPLAALEAGGPIALTDEFALETYKAALRAYVAVDQLDKAETILVALEKFAKKEGDAKANKRFTRITIGLGLELQEQLERLRQQNRTEQAAKVAQGFDLFLTKMLEREQDKTYSALNVVAELYLRLGGGLSSGGTQIAPQVASYFRKAAENYQKLVARITQPGSDATEEAVVAAKIRLAQCMRSLDDYDGAMALLGEVLRDHPNMVDAQIEAARTLQSSGDKEPRYLEFAISGPANYKGVWGWGQIARKLQSSPQHKDIFHEARYNMALCRYRLAGSLSGERQSALLRQAEADISGAEELAPDMGGEAWCEKYETLREKIRKSQGVFPVHPQNAGQQGRQPQTKW